MKLPWIQEVNDYGLFDILGEHAALTANMEKSNWYKTFSTLLDLSAGIRHHYERRISPFRLTKAINSNSFPLLDIEQTVKRMEPLPPHVSVTVALRNVGGSPAFNLLVRWRDDPEHPHHRTLLLPGVLFKVYHMVDSSMAGETVRILNVRYDNPIGVRVEDRFELKVIVGANHEVIVGTQLLEREFKRCEEVVIAIAD